VNRDCSQQISRREGDYIPLHRVREFIAPWNGLHNDVLVLHASGSELLLAAFDERTDDLFVPSRLHDADSEL
jgi:hypothetical protein